MPVRIVVGSRIKKKIRMQLSEISQTEKGERVKKSENMVIYDDEGKINLKELFKKIESAVIEYVKSKGEVTKY